MAREKKWSDVDPEKMSTRRRMRASCFLDAKNRKYPVCTKTGRFSCKGNLAAFNRARQQKRNDLAKKALRKAKREGCTWLRSGGQATKLAKRWGIL